MSLAGTSDSLLNRTLAETVELTRAGQVSAAELVDASLTRVAETDATLGSFASLQAEAAMARAAELDHLRSSGTADLGSLHGIPIALKDLIFTAGVPAEANCGALTGFTPERDATVVERLERAGAIVMGKTNTHELAFGVSCPASRNPWSPEHMTGGSSGGSGAAVASRQVFGALGSDTGGSVRIPSSYCGITGIKTTRGLVPRDGVHLISWTYDTIGPMARTAQDCALLLDVIAGPSAKDVYSSVVSPSPASAPVVKDLRLGVPTDAWLEETAPVNAEVLACLHDAVAVLAAILSSTTPVALPSVGDHAGEGSVIVSTEAAAINAELLTTKADQFSVEVRSILEAGAAMLAVDLAHAENCRRRFEYEWHSVFTAVDLVICPVTPNRVLPHGLTELHGLPLIPATTQYTFPINGAGLPAISLPAGFDSDGLPIGIQIIGPPHHESTLVAVGAAFQAATGYHLSAPGVESPEARPTS